MGVCVCVKINKIHFSNSGLLLLRSNLEFQFYLLFSGGLMNVEAHCFILMFITEGDMGDS